MAKNIVAQTLFGNPVLNGALRLSIGEDLASSQVVLETTLASARLQSAFPQGLLSLGVIASAPVDEMIGFAFEQKGSEKLYLQLGGSNIAGVTLSAPTASGVVARSTEDISVGSFLAGVATGVAIAQ